MLRHYEANENTSNFLVLELPPKEVFLLNFYWFNSVTLTRILVSRKPWGTHEC